MQEKKVDKNTFAEKSEDVWSAMQEVRLHIDSRARVTKNSLHKFRENWNVSYFPALQNQILLAFCKIFRISVNFFSDNFALRKKVSGV
jgi:hypothetical protein